MRALTDETGTTIDTRGYEAFGTKNVEAGSDPLTYGFAGEPFQQDSMLAYHRARWMDARVGRFEGMDAFDGDDMKPGTLHRYLYGSDQPTGHVDPSGNDDIGLVADFSLRSIFNSFTGTPNGLYKGTVPNGQLTYDAALKKALSAAWNLSESTYAPASDQTLFDYATNQLHPEVGGFVFVGWSQSQTLWGWVSTAGFADKADLSNLYNAQNAKGAVVWAMFHTHPNVGKSYANKSGQGTTLLPGWSCGDVNALHTIFEASNNPFFTGYVMESADPNSALTL